MRRSLSVGWFNLLFLECTCGLKALGITVLFKKYCILPINRTVWVGVGNIFCRLCVGNLLFYRTPQ